MVDAAEKLSELLSLIFPLKPISLLTKLELPITKPYLITFIALGQIQSANRAQIFRRIGTKYFHWQILGLGDMSKVVDLQLRGG